MRPLPHSIAALSLAVAAAANPRQATPTFPARVDLVRIDVTAVDRGGRPVTGLAASDFEITEKGRPREVVSFEPVLLKLVRSSEPPRPPLVSAPAVLEPDEGRFFVLFFDNVHVSAPVSEWVRESLAPVLEREVNDGDWVRVVAPEKRVSWTARTPWEHRQLPEVVRRLSGQLVRDPFSSSASSEASHADWEAMQAVEYGARTGANLVSRGEQEAGGARDALYAEMTYAVAQRRIRHSLGALREAVESMAAFRGRKSLLLVSEGFIRSPRLRDLYDEVIAAARQASVTIHFIAPQGLAIEGKIGERWLETMGGGSAHIAEETGGRSFLSNDLAAPLRQALEESSAYYLLGIVPDPRPGEHRVRVRMRRPGVKAVARSRYFVAEPGAEADRVPAATRALRSALDATALPVRVSSVTEAPLAEGKVGVALSIGLAPAPGDTGERQVSLLLAARRLEGGGTVEDSLEVALGAEAGPAVRHFRLEPGTWQARVVVTDVATGAMGSVLHTFEAPSAP